VTLVVLLILAALWAVVLLPPLVRARGERSTDSVGAFRHRLGVLGRTHAGPGTPPMAVATSHPSVQPYRQFATPPHRRVSPTAAKRRRDVLAVLGSASLVSLAGASLSGRAIFWGLFVVLFAALASYVVLLARMQRLAQERAVKVRYLPRHVAQRQPALVYRRSFGS
jgi:hypothetical protein